jgi:hypothetical protein
MARKGVKQDSAEGDLLKEHLDVPQQDQSNKQDQKKLLWPARRHVNRYHIVYRAPDYSPSENHGVIRQWIIRVDSRLTSKRQSRGTSSSM